MQYCKHQTLYIYLKLNAVTTSIFEIGNTGKTIQLLNERVTRHQAELSHVQDIFTFGDIYAIKIMCGTKAGWW